MKHKVQIQKLWETEDGANPEDPQPKTGIVFNVLENGTQHNIFIDGHNLKQNEIKKAIKDHIKTLPPKPELEGTILEVDTEEEE